MESSGLTMPRPSTRSRTTISARTKPCRKCRPTRMVWSTTSSKSSSWHGPKPRGSCSGAASVGRRQNKVPLVASLARTSAHPSLFSRRTTPWLACRHRRAHPFLRRRRRSISGSASTAGQASLAWSASGRRAAGCPSQRLRPEARAGWHSRRAMSASWPSSGARTIGGRRATATSESGPWQASQSTCRRVGIATSLRCPRDSLRARQPAQGRWSSGRTASSEAEASSRGTSSPSTQAPVSPETGD
mmetsp:Transcript_28793/g.72705  ORF Transcript_28793/g.72705 Transcript_28793/m.72705 type:complete len:245 (+) Transcript_28793:144-878(+)